MRTLAYAQCPMCSPDTMNTEAMPSVNGANTSLGLHTHILTGRGPEYAVGRRAKDRFNTNCSSCACAGAASAVPAGLESHAAGW
jgi:hypothetical protein